MTADSTRRHTPPQEPFQNFESLVYATHDQLAACAFRLLGHRDDAQDVVQTVFLNVFRKWSCVGSLDTFAQQRAYLYKAVIREVSQLKRRAYRRRESLGIETMERGYVPDHFDEHRQDAQDDLKHVWQIIDGLPTKCREVTILFAGGYEYNEITEMLQASRSTVHSHLGEARRRLRQARLGAGRTDCHDDTET